MNIISPAPHEMDMNYYLEFMSHLRSLRGQDFNFSVNAFHHYSAYRTSDLASLGDSFTPNDLVQKSVMENNNPIELHLDPSEVINTVTIESAPQSDNSYWICPELDGYRQRGAAVKNALEANDIEGEIWVTEWGYSTQNGYTNSQSAKYPPAYSGLPGISLTPREVQARWLMRGFLEYDVSPFNASLWHWLQDGNGNAWDVGTGILSSSGDRKPAWFYLHDMINEIGEKKFVSEFALNDCEEAIDYVPSIEVVGNQMLPEELSSPCPKIYKYTADADCNSNCFEDFNETVWVVWFPSMYNQEQSDVQITMAELGLSQNDFPIQYYVNEPLDGLLEGKNSVIKTVMDDFESPDDFALRHIDIKISEKPVFLHLRGERPCNNPNQDVQPDGCIFSYSFVTEQINCTSAQIRVIVEAKTGCLPNIQTSSVIASIGSNNENTDFDFSTLSDVSAVPGASNEFIITMAGLSPGEDYNFSFGAEIELNGEFGYIGGQTDVITTNMTNCFTSILITAIIGLKKD